MTTAIFAFVPSASKLNLAAALSAVMGRQMGFLIRLTAKETPTAAPTHFGLYDEGGTAEDALLYSTCKAGTLPIADKNGLPIAWGEDGLLSIEDAAAAFATLQLWLNDSDVQPPVFAATNIAAAGLIEVVDDI